jgi:hypothetical protein
MIYVSRLKVATGVLVSAPSSETVLISEAIVAGAVIHFEGGAENVGVRLLHRGAAFLPGQGSAEAWIRDNGFPIDLLRTLDFHLKDPGEVEIQAFNGSGGEIDLEVYIQAIPEDPAVRLLDDFRQVVAELRDVIEAQAK